MTSRASTALLSILLTGCQGVSNDLIAPDSREFDRFMAGQRLAAATVDESLVRRGEVVFMGGPCVMCHAIRGTLALSNVGPDLTHVASRRALAAGILPNTRGNLAGWILNPQNLKPGTQMPPTLLDSEDLHALLAYLETLK